MHSPALPRPKEMKQVKFLVLLLKREIRMLLSEKEIEMSESTDYCNDSFGGRKD
jgi:hypothetical protein